MLYIVIFAIISIGYAASASIDGPKARCRTSPQASLVEELAPKEGLYQNIASHDSAFTQLRQESLQKMEALLQDKEFRDTALVLQNKASNSQNLPPVSKTKPLNELYIFVSFSLSEKALLNLAQEAKRFGATLVLRGFKEGSYTKTAQSLHKIITKTGQGVLIDPELYSLFHITAVPTYILAKPFSVQSQERIQTPLHDKLQGHVSVQYVLESFAKEGDLQQEARVFLHTGAIP
ncbi:MAG: type-F conjugative transfer system pilin assembly protein TrbC [Alphaproteobacteria bacterium]|nr:type-F conjugative transfer system pilin assembly protein TrbC [Alphaproteobacteria bacterium]